jgi:Tol biopolymer transport system component
VHQGAPPKHARLSCLHLDNETAGCCRGGRLVRPCPEGRRRHAFYRILASQNTTQVQLNGAFLANLNRGDVVEVQRSAAQLANRFTADKPIQVVQYMNSLCHEFPASAPCPSDPSVFPATSEHGDPSMANLLATTQYQRRTRFSGAEWINVIARTADVNAGLVHLDGAPLPAASFATFASNTAWSHAQVGVSTAGDHTLESLQGHSVTMHLLTAFTTESWPAGIQFDPIPAPPSIVRSPASLSVFVAAGQNAPNNSFTVQNGGGDLLTYTVSDNASWLSVSPTSGTSSGETDTITVSYATASLAPGSYQATITISGVATNTPQTVQVNLTVQPTLTVAKSGAGAGTVSSSPAGISCGLDCSEPYTSGTQVTLTASPTGGSVFGGWSGGGCSGTGNCVVTLNADTTVTATFDAAPPPPPPPPVTLTVTRAGTGSGTVSGSGISCGSDCSESYPSGSSVTLNAAPAADSDFGGWSGGGCSGTGLSCTVTLTANTTVTATFTLKRFTLTVAKAGAGSGTVTGSGISCGSDCTESYASGTSVTLTASAAANAEFGGWSGGGCSGTGLSCTVTLGADTTVTATFAPPAAFGLTVAKAGTGQGTVASVPAGLLCGADCTTGYAPGTPVILAATAAAGSAFSGWTGGGCSGTGTCTVTLGADTAVTATFSLLPPRTVTLTVSRTGTQRGTVRSDPPGIDCGADCAEAYPSGAVVTLGVTAEPGVVFAGFRGSADCVDGVVTLTADTACQAEFAETLPPPPAQTVTVASRGGGGVLASGGSHDPVVSADGRFTAFVSNGTNLALGCTNGVDHIYVRDGATGVTTCESVGPAGAAASGLRGALAAGVDGTVSAGNGPSGTPVLSGDGTIVAFVSEATNLAPECGNGLAHVYVRNRATAVTRCVSVGPTGAPGNGPSTAPALSADGALVAFTTTATNLAGACPSGGGQVMVHNRVTATTTCESVGPTGAPGDGPSTAPALSAEGQWLAFVSEATNLALACPNGLAHIYVRDRRAGLTTCESVGPDGAAGNGASGAPALSADGNILAFQSVATNLASPCATGVQQIFRRNLVTEVTECVSVAADGAPGNGPSRDPALSGDGAVVAYATGATNLVPGGAAGVGLRAVGLVAAAAGPADQVVREDLARVRALLSAREGTLGDGASERPSLSRDGRVAAFESAATNLSPDDTNQQPDVFRVELAGRSVVRAPATGTVFLLVPGAETPVTVSWDGVAGAATYVLEFTGPDLQFANPNGAGFDAVNGAGGQGGRVEVAGTSLIAALTPAVPAAVYQVRVIGGSVGGGLEGTFSDALFLGFRVGPAAVAGQPTMTAPPDATHVARGQVVTVGWTVLPGAAQYFLEVTGTNRQFANPNGTDADSVNGAGGAGVGVVVAAHNVTVTIPLEAPPGTYQVRVIGLSEAFGVVGRFSDALTLTID